MIIDELKSKIEALPNTTTRPMFGYQCYSVNGKFYAGFSKKDKTKMIIRLSKELQTRALKDKRVNIKPFSHGAKMGWIELGIGKVKPEVVLYWVEKGYENALRLSEVP